MDTLLRDLTYAARGLRKNVGFATVATITIALGIGACTAIFSVVHAVLLRPLPYADASRLVIVWGELRARNVKDWTFSPPDFRDLQLQSTAAFDDLAATFGAGRTPISEQGGQPEQIRVAGATTNFFRLLGARIIVGRDYIDSDAAPEAQAPPGQTPPPARLPQIAILSHDGVLSTIVRQRTSEIGMRMVFGAPRASILGLVVGEGLRLGAAGVVAGLIGAVAITRVMASMLVGVNPTDPITFAAIVVLFALIAVTASWLPARRASRLDPMHAIREE